MINENDFNKALEILDKRFSLKLRQKHIKINYCPSEHNGFYRQGDNLTVNFVDTNSLLRLVFLHFKTGMNSYSEKQHKFKELTYMLDCSRNAVINVQSCKRLIEHLCVLGYTVLSLYCEDTYKVENERCFGYQRGAFTKEELTGIDEYCRLFGLRLTLSIQTLAHMRSIYRYEDYYKEVIDCNDVLLVGSKRTEQLLENMFSSLSSVLSSKTLNIGMDEPFMLGRGKYLNRNGYKPASELYLQQLELVCKIARKYGFKIYMWGDFLFSEYENYDKILSVVKENDVKVIVWGYGGRGEGDRTVEQISEDYRNFLNPPKEKYNNCAFCCSDHKYLGLAPHNNIALHIEKGVIDSAIKCGYDDIWLSSWGDTGAEVSPFATLPVIAYAGYKKTQDENTVPFEKYFGSLFGDLNNFINLDLANCLSDNINFDYNTSSKYFLYQDVFQGVMDKSVKKEYSKYYVSHIDTLKKSRADVAPEYRYLFDTQISLLNVLLNKFNIGNETREYYRKQDKQGLKKIAEKYSAIIKLIKRYFKNFRVQWYRDNKVFGFEIQEARIGALIFRMENCRKRLLDYVRSETDRIDELDNDILDLFGNGADIINLNWGELISSGVMIEYMSFVNG